MKLIARDPMHGVEAGEMFETDGAEACRLITYGYAAPADPGPADEATSNSRRPSKDAALATALRSRAR